MVTPREIWEVLRAPRQALAQRLEQPLSPRALFVGTVTPLAAIRGIAVLLRSVIAGSLLPGLVLGLGNFVLQLGVWLGLGLVLPALARQFGHKLDDRQSFTLATYASIPVWLAGVLYVVPDDYWLLAMWSRFLVFAVANLGVYIMYRGLTILEVRDVRALLLLLASLYVAYITMYTVLSVLVAVAAHVVLYVVG